MNKLKSIISTILLGVIMLTSSCNQDEVKFNNNHPVVDGRRKGELMNSFIPYSDTKGDDTIATQQFVKDNTFSKGIIYSTIQDTTKIPLLMSRQGVSTQGSNIEINAYSTLAHFGGADWNDQAKHGISFGFKNPKYYSQYPAIWIGSDLKNQDGRTASDFVVATRTGGGDNMPTIKFRVTTDGYIKAWVGYVPKTKDDIVNKAYLDYRLPIPPNDGIYVLQSDRGIVNWVKK